MNILKPAQFIFLLAVAVCAAVFLTFGPILISHGFVYDDRYLILENDYLQDWRNTILFFVQDVTQASSLHASSGYYRPLSMVLLQVLFHVFGTAAWKYHAFSIVIHALNSFLAGWLILNFSQSQRAALWAALLFAVHPVHNEVIVPVYGYMSACSAFSALLSVTFFWHALQTSKSFWFYCSLSCYAAGILFKEDILFLPFFLFFFERFRQQP